MTDKPTPAQGDMPPNWHCMKCRTNVHVRNNWNTCPNCRAEGYLTGFMPEQPHTTAQELDAQALEADRVSDLLHKLLYGDDGMAKLLIHRKDIWLIRKALAALSRDNNLQSALNAANEEIKYYENNCKCMNAVTRDNSQAKDGWVLVPREPTKLMIMRGSSALLAPYLQNGPLLTPEEEITKLYTAMISAAITKHKEG